MAAAVATSRTSIRNHLLWVVVLMATLCAGVGGWASTAMIAGALIAPGQLVVDSNVKKVQHPTGGVIGELRVREGDHVEAGDIVVRLDETVTAANLAIVSNALDELYCKHARLIAERDDATEIIFPEDVKRRSGNSDVARLMQSETTFRALRLAAREGQKAQLGQRVRQLEQEIDGLTQQIQAKTRELELIKKELDGVNDLYRRKLVPIQRVTALQRDEAHLSGDMGQLTAEIAKTRGKITETNLQIIQVGQDLRSDVAKELGEVDGKIRELVERKVTAEDQLKRIDIRAPQSGVVHQLNVHTVGGVVTPSDTLMLIVPDADQLIVEARVNPQDIDQVEIGKSAVLRFSAFNQRTTPELKGTVIRLSADTATDQRSGASYYIMRIGLAPEELARLGSNRLIAGMPVEAFVETGERTLLSYLMKPLSDQVSRAFREK